MEAEFGTFGVLWGVDVLDCETVPGFLAGEVCFSSGELWGFDVFGGEIGSGLLEAEADAFGGFWGVGGFYGDTGTDLEAELGCSEEEP